MITRTNRFLDDPTISPERKQRMALDLCLSWVNDMVELHTETYKVDPRDKILFCNLREWNTMKTRIEWLVTTLPSTTE